MTVDWIMPIADDAYRVMQASEGADAMSTTTKARTQHASQPDSAVAYSLPKMKDDGTLQVSPYDLPLSDLVGQESRAAQRRWIRWLDEVGSAVPGHWSDEKYILKYRRYLETGFYPEVLQKLRSRFDVRIEPTMIGNVYTEIIEPRAGPSAENRKRVLISLHGGGFTVGARLGGQLESIPLAAIGRCKIVSVDYRMAPEHCFPAATDDVIAVYRAILEQYSPENVGLVGCSAGAMLVAQVVARIVQDDLPMPGAVGMLYAGGAYWSDGDSAHWGAVLVGEPRLRHDKHPYFRHVDLNDPSAFPIHAPAVLSRFPPSLLISGTRDWLLSGVVHMHSRLVSRGVEARLHVWEGLGHAFFYDPDLPESREAWQVIVDFFDRFLGASSRG